MVAKGRPRAFDVDDALDGALVLFWQHGYEGTSLAQLRSALGISSASFYAAFGSKEVLFERVLERYMAGPGSVTGVVTDIDLSGREAVTRLLHHSIAMQTDGSHPRGCLIALSGTLAGDATPPAVLKSVESLRQADRRRISECVERSIERGELRAGTNVSALTSAIHGFLIGVSTLVRDGAEPAELGEAANLVLLGWDATAI